MIRTWVKARSAALMSRAGIHRLVGRISRRSAVPPVIGYHRVVEDFASCAQTGIPASLVSVRMLERHLEWLGRRYRFVDLNEIASCIERGDTSRSIALTFDDGYRDFYELAFPLLQKKGIPSTLFVVTGFPDSDAVQVHDLLYRLLSRVRTVSPALSRMFGLPDLTGLDPFGAMRACVEALSGAKLRDLTEALSEADPVACEALRDSVSVSWEQIRCLHRSGVLIGSHTRTHALLTNEDERTIQDEVSASRREIEQRLGCCVDHFAYPSGAFDDFSVREVAAAGYRYAFGTCGHRDADLPMLSIPRTLLWEHSCVDSDGRFSGPVLECLIEGAFDPISGCRRNHKRPVCATARFTQTHTGAAA